jgi:hypothetical protein
MNSPSKRPENSNLEPDHVPGWERDQILPIGHSASPPVEQRTLNELIEGGAFSDDPAWLWRSLEPHVVPEPPARLVDFWPIARRLGAVFGTAAAVAAAVVLVVSGKSAVPVQESVHAKTPSPSIASTSSAMPSIQIPGVRRVGQFVVDAKNSRHHSLQQVNPQAPPAELPSSSQPPPQVIATAPANRSLSNVEAPSAPTGNSPGPTANPPTIAPTGETSPPTQAAPSLASPKPASQPTASAPANRLELDNDEIVRLIKRGKDLLNDGDFAAARLLFERAADAGSADAATALGSTYDPLVIKRLGAIAVTPDIERARKWYHIAADRGSAAALEPLANLERAR